MSQDYSDDPIDEPFADEAQFDPDDFPDQPQAPPQRGRGKRGAAKPMPPRRYSPEWYAAHGQSVAPVRTEPARDTPPPAPSPKAPPPPAYVLKKPDSLKTAPTAKHPFTCGHCGKEHEDGAKRASYCPRPATCRQKAYRQRLSVIESSDPMAIIDLAREAVDANEPSVVLRCLDAIASLHSSTTVTRD